MHPQEQAKRENDHAAEHQPECPPWKIPPGEAQENELADNQKYKNIMGGEAQQPTEDVPCYEPIVALSPLFECHKPGKKVVADERQQTEESIGGNFIAKPDRKRRQTNERDSKVAG